MGRLSKPPLPRHKKPWGGGQLCDPRGGARGICLGDISFHQPDSQKSCKMPQNSSSLWEESAGQDVRLHLFAGVYDGLSAVGRRRELHHVQLDDGLVFLLSLDCHLQKTMGHTHASMRESRQGIHSKGQQPSKYQWSVFCLMRKTGRTVWQVPREGKPHRGQWPGQKNIKGIKPSCLPFWLTICVFAQV
jgi:hypothetical protein